MPMYPDDWYGFMSGAVLLLKLPSLSDKFMALLVLHARP